MKTKILASVALASLMSLSFIACSSEPKSVEEFSKYSEDELRQMLNDKDRDCKSKYDPMFHKIIGEENKDSIECKNIHEAFLKK